MKNGLAHIQTTFERVGSAGRAALMPYYTLGYPDAETSLAVIEAAAHAGADLLELGIPFSDPLADGPTIQRSTQVALGGGTTVARCLEMVAGLRERGVEQPLLLMGYFNPVLAFGVRRFVKVAAQAGADGFIIPDLPPEEGGEVETACREEGLALVYLLAPTSTPERIAQVAGRSTGFIYLVSLTGVTGARRALPPDLGAFIRRVREESSAPLAIGFGISTPEQARLVGEMADGVIVGSAVINTVDRSTDPVKAAGDFIHSLRRALEPALAG